MLYSSPLYVRGCRGCSASDRWLTDLETGFFPMVTEWYLTVGGYPPCVDCTRSEIVYHKEYLSRQTQRACRMITSNPVSSMPAPIRSTLFYPWPKCDPVNVPNTSHPYPAIFDFLVRPLIGWDMLNCSSPESGLRRLLFTLIWHSKSHSSLCRWWSGS